MCKGGNKATTVSNKVDPEQMKLFTQNYGSAQDVANTPFQSYTGQRVAPISGNEQLAINQAPGVGLAGMPALTGAYNGSLGLTGYHAPQANAPTSGSVSVNRGDIQNLSGGDLLSGIQKYQNPFQQGVIDTTMADLERSREMARNSDSQKATAAGAFGGSRSGVMGAETNRAYDQNAASTIANLRQAGFNTAAGLAGQDATRALQAGQANQGADLSVAEQNANLGLNNNQFNAGLLGDLSKFNTNADIAGAGVRQNAANSLGLIGGQQQTQAMNGIDALTQTGAIDRSVAQGGADTAWEEFLRQISYPGQQQDIRNSALGLIPKQTTQTTQTPQAGLWQKLLFGLNSADSIGVL